MWRRGSGGTNYENIYLCLIRLKDRFIIFWNSVFIFFSNLNWKFLSSFSNFCFLSYNNNYLLSRHALNPHLLACTQPSPPDMHSTQKTVQAGQTTLSTSVVNRVWLSLNVRWLEVIKKIRVRTPSKNSFSFCCKNKYFYD